MNSGKLFEEDFRLACKDKVAITRLYDNVGGQSGVANICDFIVGVSPFTFYLELKSTSTGTLPFGNISKTQYEGLVEISKFKHQVGGFLIKYAKFGEHYFVSALEAKRLRESGLKSISRAHIKNGKVKAIPFPSTLKRTRYTYDFNEFAKDYHWRLLNGL